MYANTLRPTAAESSSRIALFDLYNVRVFRYCVYEYHSTFEKCTKAAA